MSREQTNHPPGNDNASSFFHHEILHARLTMTTAPSSNVGDGSGGKNEPMQHHPHSGSKQHVLQCGKCGSWPRAHTLPLTASIAPVLVGHTCAATSSIITPGNTSLLRTTTISWLLFCVLIQLGTNLHNDYADFVMGADTCKRVGQAAARHPKGMWLSPQQTFAGSTMTLTLALAIGLQVIFEHVMMDPVLWFIIKWIFFVTESVLLLRHITTRS
jgi:hypothetical protein